MYANSPITIIAIEEENSRGNASEREWNELVAIYPPARITVSAFSVDIIVTQLDYNAPPPFLNVEYNIRLYFPWNNNNTTETENFAIDII